MKQLLSLLAILLFSILSYAQGMVKEAPRGFDTVRSATAHGKIDTITYASKTVGTNRWSLIYTPPGFSRNRKYPVLYPGIHSAFNIQGELLRASQ